jgi:hypothetical protein
VIGNFTFTLVKMKWKIVYHFVEIPSLEFQITDVTHNYCWWF